MFCDLPALPSGPVGEFMLNQMAAVAELEAGLISQRTKAALAAARARGVKLGGWRGGPMVSSAIGVQARQDKADEFAAEVGPIAKDLQSQGLTLRQIAAEMTRRGIRTRRDKEWEAATVRNLIIRVEADTIDPASTARGGSHGIWVHQRRDRLGPFRMVPDRHMRIAKISLS
jgi:DNA invertase Pin-like site-specific DNA recombinase